MEKLDRTAFKIQSFEQASHQREYWLSKTYRERLEAAWYLICSAYGIVPGHNDRLDRTCFQMRKRL
ncbi:MAG: hypothetical protein RMJ87_11850 [Cytophagales bacterium]|nr:hypothetical protein [Bernardetiaceae bacterium]MDW8205714.1 hypothetical protein [Cytophagales bacterium]